MPAMASHSPDAHDHLPASPPWDLHCAVHTPRQQACLALFLAVLAETPDVEAAWLEGSYAQGQADAWSDLNLGVAIRDAGHDATVEALGHGLAAACPLAWCRLEQGDPPTWLGLTEWPVEGSEVSGAVATGIDEAGGVRFTLACRRMSELGADLFRRTPARMLHGNLPIRPDPAVSPSGLQPPDPDRVQFLLEEFWRLMALMPALLNRQEHLLAVANLSRSRQVLEELVVALNGATRPPASTRLNEFLGPSQREAFEKTLVARRTGVATWIGMAVGQIVLYRWYSPQLVERYGLDYPHALERTVLALLKHDLPDWPARISTA
jgi:hypothetical protein